MLRLTPLLFVLMACRQPTVDPVEEAPLRLSATSLVFEDTFVGFPTERALELTSPGRASRVVELAATGPFSTPAMIEVPGGETIVVAVQFAPPDAGPHRGTMTVRDGARAVEVQLEGVGLAVPDCGVPSACSTPRFEVTARGCIDVPAPDGTACAPGLSCFSSATCVQGVCRGQTVTCDDGNVCTLDVCSDVGCGQIDRTPFCPASSNPCLVPSCAIDAGCGFSELPDGTACGERTCTTALICVAGACVQRTPPRSQACADVLVGVPAGSGFVDARGDDARFYGLSGIAVQGEDVVVLDQQRARRVRRGDVTTLAGRTPSVGRVDGVGSAASFASRTPSVAATSVPGLFFVGDGPTVRLVSLQGRVTTLAGEGDAGGLVDGVGAAARLTTSSRLTPSAGGTSALFVQVPEHSRESTLVHVREVELTGAVRTVASYDFSTFPRYRADLFWDVFSSGVTQTDEPVARLALLSSDPGAPALSYELTWRDGGAHLGESTPDWSAAGVSISKPTASCDLRFTSDAGTTFRRRVCGSAFGVDGDGGVYVGLSSLEFHDSRGDRVVAGPTPDRRVVDGPRDGGRLAWPRSVALMPGGVALIDSDSIDPVLRVGRLGGPVAQPTLSLETFDAGRGVSLTSVAAFDGSLWLTVETGGLLRFDLSTGAVVERRTGQLYGNASARLEASADELRIANWTIHKLMADGGSERVSELSGCFTLAAAPQGRWYAVGNLPDAGSAPRRLYRLEPDASIVEVAGPASDPSEPDGPVAQVGLSTVVALTVAPDGTVYLIGSGNRLRRIANGQLSTLLTLSDMPLDLLALDDGSLLVAVDAALLRVLP